MGTRPNWAVVVLVLLVLSQASSSKRAPRKVSWTDDEMRAFLRAVPPQLNPEHVLLMAAAESGLDPSASSGSAWGITQAQNPLLRAAGWTLAPTTFGALPLAQQLPWIGKILATQLRALDYVPESAAELYRLNLSPRAARDRASVIYTAARDGNLYRANRGLDHAGKGSITLDDLALVLASVAQRAVYKTHVAQLRRLRDADR